MFVFGKLAWLVVQPLSLVFILLAFSCLMMILSIRWLAILAGLTATLLLFVTLYTSLGAYALQVLEARYSRPALNQDPSCMVVLGGAFDLEVTAGRGGMEMNQSADRFIEAARMARLYPMSQIIVSGGDGSFSGDYKGDGELAADFLSAMGIEPGRLIRETSSRNTAENAEETVRLMKARGLENCLLITSAYHMPRALSLFEAAGANLIPWPSDYRASGRVQLGFDFTQPTLNSQLTSTAAREWLALFTNYLRGRSPSILP